MISAFEIYCLYFYWSLWLVVATTNTEVRVKWPLALVYVLHLYKSYLVTYFGLELETLGNRQLLEGSKIYYH